LLGYFPSEIYIWKIVFAITNFPSVKEVMILRQVNFEERVAEMAGCLKSALEGPCPGMSSRTLPHIKYLDYEYRDGEDAYLAMRKALLAHTG